MTFTPQVHATWLGTPPLRSGLAIERTLKGTLGVAVTLPSGTYFTCARHVSGPPQSTQVSMNIFQQNGTWSAAAELQRMNAQDEPGASPILEGLDLSLLKASVPGKNLTPDATAPLPTFGVLAPNDKVHIRASRHAAWVETTYEGGFRAQHDALFTGLTLDKSHLGIVDLTPLGVAADQHGNSGGVFWLRNPSGYAAVGHLVAVSFAAPKGLVVRYRSAFQALGLQNASVIGDGPT